jgi:hypothetical protein
MEDRAGLKPCALPKRERNRAIAVAIVVLFAVVLIAVYQLRVKRGEAECRAKCAATGNNDYRYVAPTKGTPESCTCPESR